MPITFGAGVAHVSHQGDRVIVFTDDNSMAYRIGAEFILPVITLAIPIAAPLAQVLMREIMVDGLVSIANGENPRMIESRLLGYVALSDEPAGGPVRRRRA